MILMELILCVGVISLVLTFSLNCLVDFVKPGSEETIPLKQSEHQDQVLLTSKNVLYGSHAKNKIVVEALKNSLAIITSKAS